MLWSGFKYHPQQRRAVRVPAQANTSKAQLSTKKCSRIKTHGSCKNSGSAENCQRKAQKKQSEASTSRSAHSKVHFTRRYQNPSSGSLPPRVRLKPQRYRNEENDSSLKTGLEKMRSSKMAPKPRMRCHLYPARRWAPFRNSGVPAEALEAGSGVQDATEECLCLVGGRAADAGQKGQQKQYLCLHMT